MTPEEEAELLEELDAEEEEALTLEFEVGTMLSRVHAEWLLKPS